MGTPTGHALLSASSAHRWMNCTAAPHYEEQFPSETSVFAEEGTLAHSFCELYGRLKFGLIDKKDYAAEIRKLKKRKLYSDEMLKTAEFYVEYLVQKANSYAARPYTTFETTVDLSKFIPEGFGTCDCIMIGGKHLHITDYKHGKGVAVSAEGNPQMRLYALGALERYSVLYDIETVSMSIVQPRITEDVSEDEMTADELREWGEKVKAIAEEAFTGPGRFCSGDWCRFCRGKDVCRARAENYTALEEFKDIPPIGKAAPGASPTLSNAEIGEILMRAKGLADWVKDLEAYALDQLLAGEAVPGWKIIEGRSTRRFTDVEKAFEALVKSGIDETMLYERKPKTLTELEKMVGKKEFARLAGKYVEKPAGSPKLADASDKRPEYHPAESDFKDAGKSESNEK